MEKIGESVHVNITGRGCNNSLVGTSEGTVMIDTPMFPSDAAVLRGEVSKIGPLRYIINTEPHVDHVSGAYFFDAPVIAHEGTRKAVLEASVDQYREMLKRTDPQSLLPEGFKYRPATITLSDRLTLYLGHHTFELIHLPGHSPYQVAVFVPEERVVFTSDNVTNGTPPFMHQASPLEWVDSLKRMQRLDVDKLVPGHGPVADRAYLEKMIDIVQGATDAVMNAIKKGMSLEEAQGTVSLFPQFPANERMAQVQKMSIARLYEVLKPTA
jgi:glyoxylase-like metal-dependent hydrolase (beta-lactamase superfamily II)